MLRQLLSSSLHFTEDCCLCWCVSETCRVSRVKDSIDLVGSIPRKEWGTIVPMISSSIFLEFYKIVVSCDNHSQTTCASISLNVKCELISRVVTIARLVGHTCVPLFQHYYHNFGVHWYHLVSYDTFSIEIFIAVNDQEWAIPFAMEITCGHVTWTWLGFKEFEGCFNRILFI